MSATVALLRSSYSQEQCPITLDFIVDLPDPCRVIPCGHFFSKKQLAAWQAIRDVCPLDLRKIKAIEAVRFVDSLEDATQESAIHQITTASKSNTVATTQFLQKAEKSNIRSLSSAPSVSSLEEVHLAVQKSDQNKVLEKLPLDLRKIKAIEAVRFVDSLEDATQESAVHQVATASKSNTVATTQFLQKAEKSNILSLSSAPSVSSLEEVHLAVQNSHQNGLLEKLLLYLTGDEKMKQLRFFEKCMKISPYTLSSVDHLINIRSVEFQSVQHIEYTGPFINGAYGNGSFHTQWKVFLRNDGFQGFTLLAG